VRVKQACCVREPEAWVSGLERIQSAFPESGMDMPTRYVSSVPKTGGHTNIPQNN
jgi:hypothetical protein